MCRPGRLGLTENRCAGYTVHNTDVVGATMATKVRVPLSKILTPEEMRERECLEKELYEAAMKAKRIMIERGMPFDENI